MLDVIKLFEERDTRDELGLGSIRDAFADILFPGTSTIQTRARYFLFVPWMYRILERQGVSSTNIGRVARDRELALIDALAQAGEIEGVIGIDARRRLQRLPSSIYWRGLLLWGILHFQGSVELYHRSLDSFYRRATARETGGESDSGLVQPNWHGHLPDPPDSFPGRVTLRLEAHEAEYLRDRIMTTAPRTLLAYLVNQAWPVPHVDFAWQHNRCSELPEQLRTQLEHAQNFSETLHGAMLLYNVLLAQRSHQLDRSAEYEAWLKRWADTTRHVIMCLRPGTATISGRSYRQVMYRSRIQPSNLCKTGLSWFSMGSAHTRSQQVRSLSNSSKTARSGLNAHRRV